MDIPPPGWIVGGAICPDQKLIASPKTFASQTISTLFDLMTPAIRAGNLAFPYHRRLKLSSPQRPMQDMEIMN